MVVRSSQQYTEVVSDRPAEVRLTQQFIEIITDQPPITRLTQQFLEVISEVVPAPTSRPPKRVGDYHVQRGPDDYTHALAALLPTGQAWPRAPDSTLMLTIKGLAHIYGQVDFRAHILLTRESDPRLTLELLPDWERNFGLPDPCLAEPLTVADRQKILVLKMTMLGGQSRKFFYQLARDLGYTIGIREYSPWTFGISEVGPTDDGTGTNYPRWEIGPPEIRFYWTIKVGEVRLSWWRYGSAIIGLDPHCYIGLATDLECIFNRYKPAHTEIIFDYTGTVIPHQAQLMQQLTLANEVSQELEPV